ncbi:MAG TPA: S-methyl-5-thioribose-1-phosphate isomerase [bacterium]|nr:S-methyl-5-thioribose-1-phosphate isomerase [bacterium]
MPATPDMIPIWREGPAAKLVDQRRLPEEWVELDIHTAGEMADAIRSLAIRGAPAIGIAGAYGFWLAARQLLESDIDPMEATWAIPSGMNLRILLAEAAHGLRLTRPTAVNLAWALERMHARAEALIGQDAPPYEIVAALEREADAIAAEDLAMCRAMGAHGATLIAAGETVLTHCNAGGLATGGYGTALGVIRAAHGRGLGIHVFVDETRPVGQGARLTTYELDAAGIPFTLITDSMAASLMAQGRVQRVITGADRIAANGDAVNKIGTYGLAVLANFHGIPFHIAAPSSTVDLSLASGAEIPIETRDADEVTGIWPGQAFYGRVPVHNPAFDLIPHQLITSFITEQGILEPPYEGRLAEHIRQPVPAH